MDSTVVGMGMPPALDWLLCIIALLVFIKPRFDQWPVNPETLAPAGKPRDYIHWDRYLLFVGLYLASFLLLVMVVRMLPMAARVLGGESLPGGELAALLGDHSLVAALVVAMAALANKQVATVDERWRETLLELARIPHAALKLRDDLRNNLPQLGTDNPGLTDTLARLTRQSPHHSWQMLLALPANELSARTALQLLRALHLLQCIRSFDLTALDHQTLTGPEARLEEIAVMLPARTAANDAVALNEYHGNLATITLQLTEILARLCVQQVPDSESRKHRLEGFGFRSAFTDQIDINILSPVLQCLLIIPVVSLLTLMPNLHLYDLLGIPSPEMRLALQAGAMTEAVPWFNLQRLVIWGGGATLSTAIAVIIGVIFGASMRRSAQESSVPVAILAVAVATLGSCVYFFFHAFGVSGTGSNVLRPHLFWLALAFGLMAMVVIESLHEDVQSADQISRRALVFAARYGAACGVLYGLLTLFASSKGPLGVVPIQLVVSVLAGSLRGFLLAFLVSHVIMNYVHRHINGARRRHPRYSLRQTLQWMLADKSRPLFVRNISERGALLQVPADCSIQPGDEVSVQLDTGAVGGTVMWNHHHLAGVKFRAGQPQLALWQGFIRQRVALLTE